VSDAATRKRMPNVHADMRRISRAVSRQDWPEVRDLLEGCGVSRPAIAAFLAFEIESHRGRSPARQARV
jgi:hypothetical protein